jgi:two-component system LytT family response regulator/two-component system response regulator LytT
MALRVVIVDDEPLARQELEYLLGASGYVDVVGVGANGIAALELIGAHRPDVVFLDVQMPGLDGFGVIKRLIDRKMTLPQVVFATAYDRYAVKAFEVNAVDYLLKPFDRVRVAQTVERARARVPAGDSSAGSDTGAKLDAMLRLLGEAVIPAPVQPRARSNKVVVRAQNRLLLVDQKEICFVTIEDGAISVVTATMEGQSNCRTLDELVEQLDPEMFWRAHRSFVVNLQHIREVVPWFKSTYQLRMDDPKKTEIPVSRNQTKRLRELFNL